MRVRLSTTRRHTFGNSSDFCLRSRILRQYGRLRLRSSIVLCLRYLKYLDSQIPSHDLAQNNLLGLFYKMSDPRPVSCPGCLFTSGTKRCREEEIVLPSPPPFPAPSPTINLVKRLELEDCLLLLAAAILGYVLSNPGEKTRHASFVQPPFNLASSLHQSVQIRFLLYLPGKKSICYRAPSAHLSTSCHHSGCHSYKEKESAAEGILSPLRNQISAKNDWGGVHNLFLSKDHKKILTFCQVIILLYTSSRLTKFSTLLLAPVLASRIYTPPQSLKTY